MPNYRYLEPGDYDPEETPSPPPQPAHLKSEEPDSRDQVTAHAIEEEPPSSPCPSPRRPPFAVKRKEWSESDSEDEVPESAYVRVSSDLSWDLSSASSTVITCKRGPEHELHRVGGTESSSKRSKYAAASPPSRASLAPALALSTAPPTPCQQPFAVTSTSNHIQGGTTTQEVTMNVGDAGISTGRSVSNSTDGTTVSRWKAPCLQTGQLKFVHPPKGNYALLLACIKHAKQPARIDFDAVAKDLGMSNGGARNKYRAILKEIGVWKKDEEDISNRPKGKIRPHPALAAIKQNEQAVLPGSVQAQNARSTATAAVGSTQAAPSAPTETAATQNAATVIELD